MEQTLNGKLMFDVRHFCNNFPEPYFLLWDYIQKLGVESVDVPDYNYIAELFVEPRSEAEVEYENIFENINP